MFPTFTFSKRIELIPDVKVSKAPNKFIVWIQKNGKIVWIPLISYLDTFRAIPDATVCLTSDMYSVNLHKIWVDTVLCKQCVQRALYIKTLFIRIPFIQKKDFIFTRFCGILLKSKGMYFGITCNKWFQHPSHVKELRRNCWNLSTKHFSA